MELFQHDPEKEKLYDDFLQIGTADGLNGSTVEKEMEAALLEYEQITADLGILPRSCNATALDPSQLTRWIIGEERAHKI